MADVLNMSTVNAPGFDEKLRKLFAVHSAPDCSIPEAARQARALIPGKVPVDAAMLDKLPSLEIISLIGVGYDRIDVAAAASRGIAVTNTPDVLTEDVADLAIALMIMVSRKLVVSDRLVRHGGWIKEDPVWGYTMTGKKLGILGLRAVARRAETMGMPIAYTNRSKADAPYRFVPDVMSLARDSDFLVVAASAETGTKNIINRDVIEALGPTGILVNVARGSMVDETALAEALASGKLGGAGLDAFVHEPRVSPALVGLENVVLTPHIGSGTVETRMDMADLVIANLAAHFEGRPLVSEVLESCAGRR
jgi:hydroxypyruvate reductase